jgi:hypothetical protein
VREAITTPAGPVDGALDVSLGNVQLLGTRLFGGAGLAGPRRRDLVA